MLDPVREELLAVLDQEQLGADSYQHYSPYGGFAGG